MLASVPAWSLHAQAGAQDSIGWKLDNALQFSAAQLETLATTVLSNSSQFVDYSSPAGQWTVKNNSTWCSGFTPGLLWMMYDYHGDNIWQQRARSWTLGVKSRTTATDNDTGFQIMNSFGKGYVVTEEVNDDYLEQLRRGAETLYTQRYNPAIGCYRAWPSNINNPTDLPFEVIPDQLMNLELPLFVAFKDNNQDYLNACISHADKTWEYIVRDDGSTYHVAAFNLDGTLDYNRTHQGWKTESTWSRGQAWAVYGYATVYEYTQLERMLERAEACFDYWLSATRSQSEDLVPYADFDAPVNDQHAKDTSAAAILASAALKLFVFTEDPKFLNTARSILDTLSCAPYLATGTNYQSILRRACAKWGDPETAAIFADYYFVEAALSYLELFPLDTTAGTVVNLSTRGRVGTGDDVLIGGFVIDEDPQQILVQAIGPELTDDGVAIPLMDPLIEIFDAARNTIASNDNWEDDTMQSQLIADLWGDELPLHTGSTSSAIIITLPPGSYTAVISGSNSLQGVVLLEIYEID